MTRVDPNILGGAKVLALLTDAGFLAYVVGGPVRNALLGEPVSDTDIATSARPEQVIELADRAGLKVVPTGIDHGTVTVVDGGEGFEVTTFRRDVETDGRRAVVAFADTIEEDALRRDFTMNALYADAEGRVLDPLGGLPDLMARKVRFIEDPSQRIREDYLRILRFFRFFAWYGKADDGLDADGLAACADLADGLGSLSKERIGAEVLKLLAAPDPSQSVAAMDQTGVLARILPGAQSAALPVLVHLENGLAPKALRRLAVLGGQKAAEHLRLSKTDARYLATIQKAVEAMTPSHEAGYRLGAEAAKDLILVRGALFETPIEPMDLKAVQVGADAKFPLKAMDLPHLSGKELGQALKSAEAAWIAAAFRLTADDLIAQLK